MTPGSRRFRPGAFYVLGGVLLVAAVVIALLAVFNTGVRDFLLRLFTNPGAAITLVLLLGLLGAPVYILMLRPPPKPPNRPPRG